MEKWIPELRSGVAEYSAHHGSQAASGNIEVDRERGSEFSGMHGNVREIEQMRGCD